MGKHKKLGLLWDEAYLQLILQRRVAAEKRDIKKRLKVDRGGYPVSSKEYRQILDFWKPFGVKPEKYWYQAYCNGEGGFDIRYIPGRIWAKRILPYFNNQSWGRAFADKCIYDRLFANLKRPRTIVKNSCGRFYDGSEQLISRDEAIALCLQEKRFIAKYATYSSGGKNICVLEEGEVTRDAVESIFDRFHMNFIVQELVEQHEALSRLNLTSLNTLRVMSFYFMGEVHILSAQLRIGGNGARVDNYSSNGYACNINPDGHLNERAVSKDGWVTEHPNGFVFKDVIVPSYDTVIQVIKREAERLPHLGIIGWDFGINKNGDPVFIELNIFPGQNQLGTGPTFGGLTEKVLQEVFVTKSLRDAFK